MSRAQSHSLNETSVPIPESLFGELAQAEPIDAVEIAKELPLQNRARLAAFCYARRHLNHLGLLVASTCDLVTLKRVMGTAGEVVYRQSRDVEKTLAAERGGRDSASKITLATAANVVPIR
ncbi:MAG: hypothetical protein GKR97_04820 [Rhizobiaceae bacterium]|nr:hypothetical protein [Rhizobiaceae bacterium]